MELFISPTSKASRDINITLKPQNITEQSLLNTLYDRFAVQLTDEADVFLSTDNVLTFVLRQQDRI